MVEIGLPFSDPLADGPTIQKVLLKYCQNGMTTQNFFHNLKMSEKIKISGIMCFQNPIIHNEKFCPKLSKIGIDGLIIPDSPVDVYHENYQSHLKNMAHNKF